MSAPFGVSRALANVLQGGIATWKVKAAGDAAYYSFGELTDTGIAVNALSQQDAYKRSRGFGFEVEVKAKLLGSSSAGLLQQLANLMSKRLTHKITAINGTTYTGELGLGWRFDATRDYDGFRFVEINADRKFIYSHASNFDLDDLLTTPEADGSSDPGDTLVSLSPGSPVVAGFNALGIRAVGETAWETFPEFHNAKFVLEQLTYKDNEGMSRSAGGVRILLEVDCMQTYTELAKLDTILAGSPDFKVTLADGTVFTFADNVGVRLTYQNSGDAEETSIIKFVADGVIPLSTLTGIIS